MKKTLFVVSLLLVSALLFAQETITVNGKVTGADNMGIPGVSVSILNTTSGTITDVEGNYMIKAPSDAIILFSFIGYENKQVPINGQSQINVVLQESVEFVDEVVVVGYGTQKVKDLTSAITTVKAEELVKAPAGQAMQALQGKMAGVQIVSTGNPGASATVRIRGIGSYSGGSSPLYVVNGALYDNIDFLNPSEIESVSVLKDASAAAIYGVRASNGVVMITTKGGSFNEKTTITYDGYYGVQVPTNVLKMANSEQFVDYINQINDQTIAAGGEEIADITYIQNAMQLWGRSRTNPNVPNVNTDWYKEILHQSAPIQNHSVNITGGSDKTAYALGVSYFNQEGILKMKNSYERFNVNSKLDVKANKWFKAGVNINVSSAERYLGNTNSFRGAYNAVPILPVTDDANFAAMQGSELDSLNIAVNYATATSAGYRSSQNPLLGMKFQENKQDIKKIQTGVYGEVSLIGDKVKFKTNYNVATMFLKARNFNEPYLVSDDTYRSFSNLSSSRTLSIDQYWDNTLNYEQDFGKHHVSAMAGMSFRDEMNNYLGGSVQGIVGEESNWYINSKHVPYSVLVDGEEESMFTNTKTINEYGTRFYGLSYFGRASYKYNNRYIAYFTIRRDGSHRYQDKWGVFPAFGLGWVVSEEDFFDGVEFVDYLKLRGGWGKLGRDDGATSAGSNTVNTITVPINDAQANGTYSTSTYSVLGWEVVEGTNIGLTATMFNSRLNMEADYFVRNTQNAIIPVSLLLQAGSVRKNVGGIQNSGLEMSFDWNDKITPDLSYNVSVNFATLKNEVTDLYGQEYINSGSSEFRQRTEVGHPLYSFYGYEVAGVYQNQAEIDADPIAVDNGLVAGDFRFKDRNGDDVLDDEDKTYLGSYFPDLTYGGSVGLNYKNLSFSMNFMGQMGNKILNRKRGEIIWTNDMNQDAELLTNLWNGEGTSNKYPSASGLRRGWNQNFSDFLVEDGSFFRIQNIQLAYTVKNDRFFEGMPETRVYVTAEKPLTSFKYNGFSPEVPNGIDLQYYPIPAIYTIGVNLKF